MTYFSLFLPFCCLTVLDILHLILLRFEILFSRSLHSSLLTIQVSTEMNHFREAWSLDERAPKHVSIAGLVGRFLSSDRISRTIIDLPRVFLGFFFLPTVLSFGF